MDIERLLLSLFSEDNIINKNFSYISQLSVLTIKSLIPMKNEIAVRIDYKRFIEELKLWFYYRIGENPSLTNIEEGVSPHIYWNSKDDSIIGRLIPIVLSNSQYEVIEEEIIRNILFTTGNLQELLEWISISYLLHELVSNSLETKNLPTASNSLETTLINKLKEKIINFSQGEYIDKFQNYYRIEIENFPGNFKVEFERERIHLLNFLNGVKGERYLALEDVLDLLENKEPNGFTGKILNNYLYNLDKGYNLPQFYTALGEYVINLRKSRIDPVQLEIKEYILPDIFSFNEGDVFYHSLLRESKVVKKEVRDGTLTSLVQTRTGMYIFKK